LAGRGLGHYFRDPCGCFNLATMGLVWNRNALLTYPNVKPVACG
jgi:hypothetical protein